MAEFLRGSTILNEHDEFCFRTTIIKLSNEFTSEFDDILDPNPRVPRTLTPDPYG